MTILVDIGHPGHVHLFRRCMRNWEAHGHRVVVTIRERGIVAELLRAYGIPYEVASRAATGRVRQTVELVEHDWHVWRIARRERADVLAGTSVAVAHAACFLRARSVVFEEDDADIIPLFARLTYPFADHIVIPDCLRDRRTPRHVAYDSYHELAYLHPNHFTPDPSVLDEAGLSPDEPFFIVRHVALTAFHDVGQHGLDDGVMHDVVTRLSAHGRVLVTAEDRLPPGLETHRLRLAPHRIHDLMAFAALVVSDSQTMTAEAAVLGVPSLRFNTFVGRLSYLEELEHRYALTFGFSPGSEPAFLAKLDALLALPDRRRVWQKRRDTMLKDKCDAAAWITAYIESLAP